MTRRMETQVEKEEIASRHAGSSQHMESVGMAQTADSSMSKLKPKAMQQGVQKRPARMDAMRSWNS